MNVLDAFLSELDSRGELVPGARERLRRMAGDYRSDTARAMDDLLSDLAGPGSGYLTPEGRRALRTTDPLPFLLARVGLRSGSAEQLYESWAADAADLGIPGGLTLPAGLGRDGADGADGADGRSARARWAGAVARLVADRLGSDEYRHHLDSEPVRPYGVQKVLSLLERMQEEAFIAPGADLDTLAREWGDLALLTRPDAAARAALRLQQPRYRAYAPADGPASVATVRDAFREDRPATPKDVAEALDAGYPL